MKIYLYTLIGLLALYFTSCQDPETLSPTVERNALTSLRATFTEGAYKEGNDGAANFELKIEDPSASVYKIPIPWFFPESSENHPDITKMRIRAELGSNCKLTPGLDILDLTKDNHFTLTYPDGSSREINITGDLYKLTGATIEYFSIVDEKNSINVVGNINQETSTITLITLDDLSTVSIEATLYPHASFETPVDGQIFDLNKDQQLTVLAHDGITKKTYTIKKTIPAKIPYGFDKDSQRRMWSINPGTVDVNWGAGSTSLAVIGDYLIVSSGDGTAPVYLNKMTGKKIGTIAIGVAKATGSVVNDENGNLLISNTAETGQALNIFKTKSVTTAPTSFITYSNTTGFTISRISIQGDIDSEAVIIATCDGSSKIVRWQISGGVVGVPSVETFTNVAWGTGASNTKVTTVSTNKDDGYLLAYYDANSVSFVDGKTNVGSTKMTYSGGDSWGLNFSRLDVKTFNNARYFALASVTHFPHWGMEGKAYLYDITNVGSLSGDIDSSSALVFSTAITRFNDTTAGVSANGDIILAPSADGYYLYMFCWDNNAKTLMGYSFDCVDTN